MFVFIRFAKLFVCVQKDKLSLHKKEFEDSNERTLFRLPFTTLQCYIIYQINMEI